MTQDMHTYVFQSNMGGHKITVVASDYHSAYKEIMNVLPGAKLVDFIDTVVDA